MSVLKVPSTIYAQLDQLSRRFWWNVREGQSSYFTPISWVQLCYPKHLGGLGFKRFENINLALLAKLTWQFQTETTRLWVQIFKAKYIQDNDLLTAYSYKHGTWAWKGIVDAVTILKRGACYLVRSGNLCIIDTPWLPTYPNFRPTTSPHANINLLVKELWWPHTKI